MASANMVKIVRDRTGNCRRSSMILCQRVIVVRIGIRSILQERCQIQIGTGDCKSGGERGECTDFALARFSNRHINEGSFQTMRERLRNSPTVKIHSPNRRKQPASDGIESWPGEDFGGDVGSL